MNSEKLKIMKITYILSYILPIPIYLFFLLYGFIGLNLEIVNVSGIIGYFIFYFLMVIEMTVLIGIFNFVAYLLNLWSGLKVENKKLFKMTIKFNMVIVIILIILFEVLR